MQKLVHFSTNHDTKTWSSCKWLYNANFLHNLNSTIDLSVLYIYIFIFFGWAGKLHDKYSFFLVILPKENYIEKKEMKNVKTKKKTRQTNGQL